MPPAPSQPAGRLRSIPAESLIRISVGSKLSLLILLLVVGIAAIFFASARGFREVSFHLSNIYYNTLIPVSKVTQGETALADIEAQIESLRNPNLVPIERVSRIESILSAETIFDPILAQYESEWVTTKNPRFTAVLAEAGRLGLQQEELATLAALRDSYAAYQAARVEYQEAAQAGHITDELEKNTRQALFESRGHLRQLIEINEAYAELSNAAAQSAATRVQLFMVLVLVITIILGVLLAYVIAGSINNRLNIVKLAATSIQEGQLDQAVRSAVGGSDEITTLAAAVDSMAQQMSGLVSGLEARVQERTAELEAAGLRISRRANQFEALARVSRAIGSTRNLENLLPDITTVISEQFGFYHVGIFLLDENREYAVLNASNSHGGQRLLARGHRLRVGETGIVGYVTNTGHARVALDTGVDAVFFDNPDLPETHSEMALPLRIGNQTIGALDVQSTEPNAFSQEDISVLSTLADQVSIAIQNSRLFDETRRAMAESESLYGRFIREGWRNYADSKKLVGIRRTGTHAVLLKEPLLNVEAEIEAGEAAGTAGESLTVPVTLRGEVIGVLKVKATELHTWDQDEMDIAQAIAERTALALENARLLEEAQRRAVKERVIGEISTKISASINMRNVLQTAVEELGHAIPGSDVIIQFQPSADGNSQDESGA
jgi:GAF domain-containing protein/HAMP domain-containing protein